jgi:uncharacterized membrane protein
MKRTNAETRDDTTMNENIVFALFLCVGIVGFFSFLAVTIWSRERRREREAYYKSETLKKIVETQGAGGSSAMEFLHESEKYARLRQREWLKLAGLVTTAVGIGMMVFIKAVDRGDPDPAYLVGLIPLFIGVALLAYTYCLSPKQ